ncbi:hypothetical protein ABZX85_47600 [Streptomyces sp. NPDC004539]|uniref:hypothetical protein n=1 Tax=Streptomyces sp. NPDC004539 TaxID=3154280 RepID=UPI0033B6C798
MIAACFNPLDIECLVKTAVELWDETDCGDLSEHQQDTLDRARSAILAEHAGRTPSSPEAVTFISPRPAGHAWVLRRWDRHDDVVTLHVDEDSALAELAVYVREVWHNLVGKHEVPAQPPTDDRAAVRLYYGPDGDDRPDEGYDVYAEGITRHGRTRIVPLDFHFPDEDASEQANRDATFHPQTDDNDLPCVEVDGVLVFTYLDHEAGAVRVSVGRDLAQDRLVRPDGTIPLRVDVDGAALLDDSVEDGPPWDVLNKLLDAADDHQERAIREAAVAAGVLWHCPICEWDNPCEAAYCEGPGLCRAPKPKKTSCRSNESFPNRPHSRPQTQHPIYEMEFNMQTYTFVLDQPEHQDLDGPHYVVAEGDTCDDAEIRARDHLHEVTRTPHGFRRTLVFVGAPLTPPDTEGGEWHDTRTRPAS